MRIETRKIGSTKIFTLQKDGIEFRGEISPKARNLFILKGVIKGNITLICDRSGEEFISEINEDLVLYISDGIWDTQSQNIDTFDVVEFFDGFIDLDYILSSEIQSIQSDYHIKTKE